MRLICLFLMCISLSGCAMSDHGWQLTRGMRRADGTIVPKMTPVRFDTGPVAGTRAIYVQGDGQTRSPQASFDRVGGLERAIPLNPWRGKRVQLSLRLENKGDARAYALAQVNRSDGPAIRTVAQRNSEGTSFWETHRFVMDVPDNATSLFLYAGLTGKGTVWVDDITLDAVDTGVALTPTERVATFSTIGCFGTCWADDYLNGGYVPPSTHDVYYPPGPPAK
jgi:hypothetical protein